jgi:2-amino-4-hydroxy-6-hydroxymethyldihydropteridine diphosphokinase
MTNTVYISLGSNLENPRQQVITAVNELKQHPGIRVTAISPWYRSQPMGPQDQPDYINGVARLETELDPEQLLAALQAIENAHQRIRTVRWGARTLDLDILLFGTDMINLPHLQIPHPGMTTRNFVLLPLADIAPELVLPNGTSLVTLLEICSSEGIVRLSPDGSNQNIG